MAHYLRFLLTVGAEGVLGQATSPCCPDATRRLTTAGTAMAGTEETRTRRRLGHGGGMVGMFADVQVDRDRGIGSCLLVNGYADVSQANLHVLRQLCDLPTTSETWPRPEQRDDGADHPYRAAVGLYRSYNPGSRPCGSSTSRASCGWPIPSPVASRCCTRSRRPASASAAPTHPTS